MHLQNSYETRVRCVAYMREVRQVLHASCLHPDARASCGIGYFGLVLYYLQCGQVLDTQVFASQLLEV